MQKQNLRDLYCLEHTFPIITTVMVLHSWPYEAENHLKKKEKEKKKTEECLLEELDA